MIKKSTPLTLSEVNELAGDNENAQKIKSFIKQFGVIDVGKAKEMREKLKGLDLIKLKDEDIVKIIDFKPEDSGDLAKILHGVSLDQDEANKILTENHHGGGRGVTN